jgi:hypothetical protein
MLWSKLKGGFAQLRAVFRPSDVEGLLNEAIDRVYGGLDYTCPTAQQVVEESSSEERIRDEVTVYIIINYKRFWEELIAYFP